MTPVRSLTILAVAALCALMTRTVSAASPSAAAAVSQTAPPDLSGIWMNDNTLDEKLKREGRERARADEFEPPHMEMPLTPEYQAIYQQRQQARRALGEGTQSCKWPGMPGMMTYPYPFEILQAPGRMTLLFEADSQVRRIFFRRKHLDADDLDPSYYGDSIGHWEGAVLVVDTIGFNTDTEVRGMPHSDQMHITERIRFIKRDTIEDALTIVDPKAFTRPITQKIVYSRRPDWRIREYSCEENNRDAPGANGQRSSGVVASSAGHWVTSWAATLQRQRTGAPAINNQTIRQSVVLSAGGSRIRVRFSNEFGTQNLRIGGASVRLGPAGPTQALTFGAAHGALVPAGAPLLSDPLDLPSEALQTLEISLFLPDATSAETYERLAKPAGATISPPGDFTATADMPRESDTYRSFLSSVEVQPSKPVPGLVVFSDTKSAGPGTWPEFLVAATRGQIAVANRSQFAGSLTLGQPGESGLARFDRDVASVEGADKVLIFMGNNDLIQPGAVGSDGRVMVDASLALSTDQLIDALRQVARRTRARGLKAIGVTWLPYEGVTIPGYATPEKLAKRDAINAWIRSSTDFDQIIDLDAALRDPEHPARLASAYDSGNHFTPSEAGYRKMADVVRAALGMKTGE
jgi:lysophospholipase L1-like esterase